MVTCWAVQREVKRKGSVLMEQQHDIVIVGGGICEQQHDIVISLGTTLALHRKGVNALVLEKSGTLRAEGIAIGVHVNAWHALDQLGVGVMLRSKATPISEIQHVWLHKDSAQVTPCRKQELRCLKRSDLVEALAENLPQSSLRLGYHIVAVDKDPITSFAILHIDDGSTIKAKVLIGCDGSNSVIARSLGLKAPNLYPDRVIRGITSYPNGHNFDNKILRLQGDNVFLGRIPINNNLVHWFVDWKQPSKEIPKDVMLVKDFVIELLADYPSEVIKMVEQCDLSTLNVSLIRYRAPWHLLFASLWKDTTTIAGDAMHVMGPFLGQGGGAALEDAIVLARCLADAMHANPEGVEGDLELQKRVEAALGKYVKERRLRVLRLSVQTYLTGLVLAPSKILRLVSLGLLTVLFGGFSLSHTEYNCGQL